MPDFKDFCSALDKLVKYKRLDVRTAKIYMEAKLQALTSHGHSVLNTPMAGNCMPWSSVFLAWLRDKQKARVLTILVFFRNLAGIDRSSRKLCSWAWCLYAVHIWPGPRKVYGAARRHRF